jgi:hypothetical protein
VPFPPGRSSGAPIASKSRNACATRRSLGFTFATWMSQLSRGGTAPGPGVYTLRTMPSDEPFAANMGPAASLFWTYCRRESNVTTSDFPDQTRALPVPRSPESNACVKGEGAAVVSPGRAAKSANCEESDSVGSGASLRPSAPPLSRAAAIELRQQSKKKY